MLRMLLDRVRQWRERRNPVRLVSRLYAEGIIDDEMLLAARGQHPSQPYDRTTNQFPRRDSLGQPITDEQFESGRWVEITTFQDVNDEISRWVRLSA